MSRGEWHVLSCLLVALYRRLGTSVAPRSQWPKVWSFLRGSPCSLGGGASALQRAGFWYEASLLEEPGRLASAEHLVEHDKVLTIADEGFPRRWLDVLGSAAPPVLYREGPLPVGLSDRRHASSSRSQGGWVSVVGSRNLSVSEALAAQGCGAYLAASGSFLVTGGAKGADALALHAFAREAPGRSVVLLPHGLGQAKHCADLGALPDICWLSPYEPTTAFSRAHAMERNALIYAWSKTTIVVAVRHRVGGTWNGAIDASRRKLTRLGVIEPLGAGGRALVALGGHALPALSPALAGHRLADSSLSIAHGSADDFASGGIRPEGVWQAFLDAPEPVAQPSLFGGSRVRENRQKYRGVPIYREG